MSPSTSLPVRVIVVGPGALEAALFAEPGLRVVRAPAIFDAIGELCDATDPDFGRPAIVVVSSEVERTDPPELFTRGLRLADPSIKVIRAETEPRGDRPEASPAHESGYDSSVPRSRAAAEVRRLAGEIRAAAAPAARAPAAAPAAPKPAAGQAPAALDVPPPSRTANVPPDVAMVHAVLGARPVLDAALAAAGERLGRSDLRFVPEGQAHRADPGSVVADVRHESRLFGVLVLPPRGPGAGAAEAERAAVAAEAVRLGAWLQLEAHVRSLQNEALRDPLTDAWNRRYFDSYLPRVLERARDLRQPVTLMVFDIDGFKSFNDRFGHPAGDSILIATVRLLNTIVRPTDRVCRVGGDEFAVIFFDPEGPRKPGAHPLSCREMAHRFQEAVNDQRFPELGLHAPGALTISAGMATYPWDAQDAEKLLAAADRYALESKRTGKKRITIGPGVQRPGA